MRQQKPELDPQISDRLSSIAQVSNRSMKAINDIVWAINPNRDSLQDLIHRMRRFADAALASRNITIHLSAPDSLPDRFVATETRREVFLIFKEAVNNIARHSKCTQVEISLRIDKGEFPLELSDDGQGMAENNGNSGNGLESMPRRAGRLNGNLSLLSLPRKGTSISLRAPFTAR